MYIFRKKMRDKLRIHTTYLNLTSFLPYRMVDTPAHHCVQRNSFRLPRTPYRADLRDWSRCLVTVAKCGSARIQRPTVSANLYKLSRNLANIFLFWTYHFHKMSATHRPSVNFSLRIVQKVSENSNSPFGGHFFLLFDLRLTFENITQNRFGGHLFLISICA